MLGGNMKGQNLEVTVKLREGIQKREIGGGSRLNARKKSRQARSQKFVRNENTRWGETCKRSLHVIGTRKDLQKIRRAFTRLRGKDGLSLGPGGRTRQGQERFNGLASKQRTWTRKKREDHTQQAAEEEGCREKKGRRSQLRSVGYSKTMKGTASGYGRHNRRKM